MIFHNVDYANQIERTRNAAQIVLQPQCGRQGQPQAKLFQHVVGLAWQVSDDDGPLRLFRTRRAAQAFARHDAGLVVTKLSPRDPLADAEPALF